MTTKIEHICDICTKPATLLKISTPMRFVTEQTEGRYTTPYLEIAKMDLCAECATSIVAGQPLEAEGAQGHNRYKFAGARNAD